MVFVLFHCRRYHEKASQKETVSHMFALKRKKMLLFSWTFTVVRYIKKWLDCVDVYCALLLVDYWKSSVEHVSS